MKHSPAVMVPHLYCSGGLALQVALLLDRVRLFLPVRLFYTTENSAV